MISAATCFFLALFCTAWLTKRYLVYALGARIMDVPNERSSHIVPTARGGGIAFVVVISLLLVLISLAAPEWRDAGFLTVVAGIGVAAIGFMDDKRGVPANRRFLVHIVAVVLMLVSTNRLGPLALPGLPPVAGLQLALAAISLLWLLNLFNFMDGIDGIAAMEATFVSVGLGCCLLLVGGASWATIAACMTMAGGAMGFLLFNWPPAKIFMGDVGSGFLGFMLGALAVVAHREASLNPFVAAILLGTFVTDATVTLVRRAYRREKWYEAHRSHAYQWLSRLAGSHRPVTLGFLTVNVVWLLPLAIAATVRPQWSAAVCCIAYLPLVLAAAWAGAGRPELTSQPKQST